MTADGEATMFAEGFTNIIDLAFDSAGNLYVVEIAANGLLGFFDDPENPAASIGAVYRVATDGTRTLLSDDGVILSTGAAVGFDDAILVANFGLVPEDGQVILFPPQP